MSVDNFIAKLGAVREVSPRKNHRRSFIAQCPAHDDTRPSLYVDEGESGNVLIKCWAGCGATDVINSVDLCMSELFPDSNYDSRSRRVRKDLDYNELHLEISRSARNNGKKQSEADKKSELDAFMAVRRGRQ